MSGPVTIQWYVFKEFLKRFVPALLVLFFIFVLQTFWVYFDELAGKGLSLWVIFKFFYYFSPNIFIYSLPLAILLAGIMTYGSLGEKYELAAIKSSGVSVFNSMRILLIFNIVLAIFLLFFVNTVQPEGNLKFTRLRSAIARKMPSAVIRQGVFSEIGDFSIKVQKKYGEDDRLLENIIIHQEVTGIPDKVIIAEKGEFHTDPRTDILSLKLYNGEYFEDLTRQQKKSKDREQLPALYSVFKEYIINIDLSQMNRLKERDSQMKLYHMLNMKELGVTADSLKENLRNKVQSTEKELISRHYVKVPYRNAVHFDTLVRKIQPTPSEWNSIYSRIYSKVQGNISFITRKAKDLERHQKVINKYIYTWHEKLALPFYIFLLFLVGIPLGAMIRKGGFGLPFVLGIIIYAAFYMLNMLGAGMAEEGLLPAWLGAWLPVIVLLPLVIYMVYNIQFVKESLFIKYFKRFTSKLAQLFQRKEIQTDAVFIPSSALPGEILRDSLYNYKLSDGFLLYKKHEHRFDKWFDYLRKTLERSGADYILGYWKPDEHFARKHQVLGDVLMIKFDRDGQHMISTNLDVNYRYDNGRLQIVKNTGFAFIPYKVFKK